MLSPVVEKYMREDNLPHIWCPGCSNGILIHDIAVAIERNGLTKDQVCIVSASAAPAAAAVTWISTPSTPPTAEPLRWPPA